MGTPLKGRDFALLMERTGTMNPACCGRDLSLNISSETIEATKEPQSRWKSFIYGIKSYTVSFSGVTIIDPSFTIKDFYSAMDEQRTIAFVAQSDENEQLFFAGNVLITGIELSGSYKDVMTYSITALGDGQLRTDNPYSINIITDGAGNALTDENGNILTEQLHGDLLPINYNINC